ncbi:hypothetical protein BWI15_34980 [Kribbella sp. ALI-6-A]|uniref:hypothetical protein n=1 Tax=Kribbella sp. ALI-6-A TaxID=1933817 RepID=UPI00097C2F8C|nr:hypothetical protein [Kribbella sp. ALI-6-A]ONI68231.1 hypothetical protein BWI15_34980 [Kribbella sp. ALI-6-A]
MKTAVLASGVVLVAVIGGVGGYVVGDLTEPTTTANANGTYPTGDDSPPATDPPLPRKTPEPNTLAALEADELSFRTQNFTIHDESGAPVRLSIRVPRGWQLTRDPKMPREVKFLDPERERAVRVESALPDQLSPTDSMNKLVAGLKSSQPYENDLKILSQTDGQLEANGEVRTVSTLVYTFIPIKTLRHVIVRWVATGGDDVATVEMSITGLPQDAAGLNAVALEASRSVRETG